MRQLLLLAAFALVASPVPAAADTAPAPEGDPALGRRALVVTFENDLFIGSDRNYTNGVQVSLISRDFTVVAADFPWFAPVWDGIRGWLPEIDRSEGDTVRAALHLGQLIYTPQDYSRVIPDPLDRPYAGWLYLGLSGLVQRRHDAHRVELQVGVTGEASLAEEAQKFVHSARDLEKPYGWGSQLETEPNFLLAYDYQRRLREPASGGWDWEVAANAGATVGTLKTHASAGLLLRAGWNLPLDLGGAVIRPAGDTFVPGRPRGTSAWTFAAFAAVEGRAVARDLFLDGPTFHDGPSVDKESLVGDTAVGFTLGWRDWRLSYSHVYRGHEFKTQPNGHRFASLAVARVF